MHTVCKSKQISSLTAIIDYVQYNFGTNNFMVPGTSNSPIVNLNYSYDEEGREYAFLNWSLPMFSYAMIDDGDAYGELSGIRIYPSPF